MKMKKLLVALLTLSLLATGMIGNQNEVLASSTTDTKSIIAINGDEPYFVVKPGETTHIKLPVRSVGCNIYSPQAKISDSNTASPFIFSSPVLMTDHNDKALGIYESGFNTYAEFDVTVNEAAKIGSYNLKLVISGYYDSTEYSQISDAELQFTLHILEEMAPAQLTVSDLTYKNSAVGCDTDLNFTVKNEGEVTARNTYININYGDTGIEKRYTTKNVRIGDLEPGKVKAVTFPITILNTATIGKKTLTVNFIYKNINGSELTDSYAINVNVKENDKAPSIDIESVTYRGELKQGDDFTLIANLNNNGYSTAREISVALDTSDADNVFIKNYFTDVIDVYDIKQGNKQDVKIPIIVSKLATGGPHALKLKISYKDQQGVPYSVIKTIYPQVVAADTADKPNIVISNVKQSPAQPQAGQKMTVSFDFENKSGQDINNLKIGLANLTGTTFIPEESEPYQYIDSLKAGAVKRITIPLTVSKSITEGLNNLTVKYDYENGGTGSVDIPILDVKNELGSKSKPKLIISKYSTDVEELKAGKTFNFIFDIYNTHSAVAAKNITITVTQPDNIFSVTQGSNSFFINKIDAGQTVQKTLEMKVKSDAKTSAYKLNIKIEYEYDGMQTNPETGQTGESRTEELNLMAVENARPVVNNINVYSNDGNVAVGGTAMVSFEFYNMGKSPLNNVRASIEGDFTKTSGDMQYIGNVAEGTSQYVEVECTPNKEGQAKGVLKITYEDSNGDEVSFSNNFETAVTGAQTFDPNANGQSVDTFNPAVKQAKKAILPVWAFVAAQVVLFAVCLLVTRKIIINAYKKKQRRIEEEKV